MRDMKMVVTLKSGTQIKADVEDYTTQRSPIFGELRGLKWRTTEQPSVVLSWLNPAEVAAIHAEFEEGEPVADIEEPDPALPRLS